MNALYTLLIILLKFYTVNEFYRFKRIFMIYMCTYCSHKQYILYIIIMCVLYTYTHIHVLKNIILTFSALLHGVIRGSTGTNDPTGSSVFTYVIWKGT